MESWTLKETTMTKIEDFEMWLFRRMLKIPWTEHMSIKLFLITLHKPREEKEILSIIKKRKPAYFGHILRNDKYHLLHLIIKGKIEGKRGPGGKQM